MRTLDQLFADCRAAGRAALIGYYPAGYPTVDESVAMVTSMVEAGCDIIEVGVPFTDPMMDGPTIQHASSVALAAGVRVADTFAVVRAVAAAGGVPTVMSYWNPILAYGVERFAADLAAAGGQGIITPDLIPEEAADWTAAARAHHLGQIFLVAPSSTPERLAMTCNAASGFIYAQAVMGVTGARETVSAAPRELVHRVRELSSTPVCVGLGVRTGDHAAEIAGYADGVIVGSALISAASQGEAAVRALVAELADGVRRPVSATHQPTPQDQN